MDELPREILEDIFSYFPMEERVLNLRPVCQFWAEIIDSSPEWKTFKHSIRDDSQEEIKLLESMPSLQFLNIMICSVDIFNAIAQSGAKYQELKIFSFAFYSYIAEVIRSSSSTLKKLCICGEAFQDFRCLAAIAECRLLEDLAVDETLPNQPMHYRKTGDGFCHLKKFYSYDYTLTNYQIQCLFEQKCNPVQPLSSHHIIQKIDWTIITTSHYKLNYLKELHLFAYPCEDFSLLKFVFMNCPAIAVIDIHTRTNAHLPADDYFDHIHNCPNIKYLCIKNATLTERGLLNVSNCLQLTTLRVRLSEFGPSGEQIILGMKKLHTLYLDNVIFSINFLNRLYQKSVCMEKVEIYFPSMVSSVCRIGIV